MKKLTIRRFSSGDTSVV